jgi:excisionase family DNA binding protein
MKKTKQFLTIPESGPVRPAEAAAYLRINRCTLYEWAKQGRVTIHKAGPKVSYLLAQDLRKLSGEAA